MNELTITDMNKLDELLRTFRRQLVLANIARIALVVLAITAFVWSVQLPDPLGHQVTLGIFGAVLFLTVLTGISTLKLTREVHAGSVLLNTGRLDDAAIWLQRAISRFSLSVQGKFIAAQQMAVLHLKQDAHSAVVRICREMLRHRMTRWRSVWFTARLMLADSLLMLNREAEAYEAMQPVFGTPLSLLERMRLLPVQLRYELAANHPESAVRNLPEKTRIAEMLDSNRAALVHALLAEACDRQAMSEQRDFLIERAWLYDDVRELAKRYPIISPMAERSQPAVLDQETKSHSENDGQGPETEDPA